MLNFDDPWWLTALLLVVVLWIMGVVIPVRMVAPRVAMAEHFVDADDSPEQDAPAPPRRPGLLLPILTFLAGLGLVALSTYKQMREPEGGTRWVWMAAAAGLSVFWTVILMLFTVRMR